MAIDPKQIELTPEQRRAIAEKAELTGKPWDEILSEALSNYMPKARANRPRPSPPKSFYDVMLEDGAIGVVTENLPHDLSTNPKHMEGFGRDEGTSTR